MRDFPQPNYTIFLTIWGKMVFMTDEHDLIRSDWEGMAPSEPLIDVDLRSFLEEIRNKFKEDENMWGVREAACEVLKNKEEAAKIELLSVIRKNFAADENLSVDNLTSFLEKEGAEILRDYMRQFLGEAEWMEMQSEGGTRNMRHDQTFGGTPG